MANTMRMSKGQRVLAELKNLFSAPGESGKYCATCGNTTLVINDKGLRFDEDGNLFAAGRYMTTIKNAVVLQVGGDMVLVKGAKLHEEDEIKTFKYCPPGKKIVDFSYLD